MLKIFVLCVVAISICAAQMKLGSQCTPRGSGYGICKDIVQCPRLLSSLGNMSFVMEHYCGKNNGFCCSDCYTPEGQPGYCTEISRCPHLGSLPMDQTHYVRNSKCPNEADSQYCCGPPPAPVRSQRCALTLSWVPPNPDSGCCGHSSGLEGKIIGGNDTSLDEYPWLVILEYKVGKRIIMDCGGTLISNRYVVTAAHCVTGRNADFLVSVRLGEFNTSNADRDCDEFNDCADLPVSIPVEKIIVHPEYNSTAKWNDIALIRLSDKANYTDFIRPICLPTTDIPDNGILSSYKVYAAGWGKVNSYKQRSETKQHVQLPLVTMQMCSNAYKRSVYKIWNKQICAGGEAGKDSCKGDSGGPLMVENAAKRLHEIIGVVSFGPKGCGVRNVPGVYTRVYEYNTWIRSKLEP